MAQLSQRTTELLDEYDRRITAGRRCCASGLRDEDIVKGRQLREVLEWLRFGTHETNIIALLAEMYEARIAALEDALAEKLRALDRAIADFEKRTGESSGAQRKDAAAAVEGLRKLCAPNPDESRAFSPDELAQTGRNYWEDYGRDCECP
jgi:hypothetical protein